VDSDTNMVGNLEAILAPDGLKTQGSVGSVTRGSTGQLFLIVGKGARDESVS